jgi:hypothetical protein
MGAPSDALTIYNLALLQLKQQAITSFDDPDNVAATVGSMIYDQTRRALLSKFAWNCARKYGVASLKTDTTPLFNFSGAYTLPDDLLVLRQVGTQRDQWCPTTKYSYDLAGRVLYYGDSGSTPPNSLYILYTADLTDIVQMDSVFVETLVFALAKEAALPITGDPAIQAALHQRYLMSEEEAKAINRQARPLQIADRNPFSEARWRSGDWFGNDLEQPTVVWPDNG